MDNEELDGVKFSEFPSQTPVNADEVVGLHSGDNARFSIANIVAAVRNGLASIFVPLTRTINGKGLSTDITLDATDVGAVDTADVGVADGVASLDSTGKVPSAQLPSIPSDASDIDYDNTGSGLTATDVQEAIDELAQSGGGGTAASISYDNTGSGLSATDVQDAIDELAAGGGGGGPSPYTSNPAMDGTASPGSSNNYARGDHVHPENTNKANNDEIGIVVNGNSSTQGADIGQYVILRNSTISYRADGLYRAAKTIPANTPIDWSYIGSVDDGGLNSLNARMPKCGNESFTVSYNGAATVHVTFDVPFPQGTNYAVCVCQSGQYAYSNLDFGSTNRTVSGFDLTVSSTRSGTFTGNAFWVVIPY